jgi:hypothetical protein
LTAAAGFDSSASFDDLGDAEKVKFVQAELAATLGKLDDMIARLTALRTEVDDPDGLVGFTLGEDGRLLSLFIDDAVRTSLTNLGLERKLNDLFLRRQRGNAVVAQAVLGQCGGGGGGVADGSDMTLIVDGRTR